MRVVRAEGGGMVAVIGNCVAPGIYSVGSKVV